MLITENLESTKKKLEKKIKIPCNPPPETTTVGIFASLWVLLVPCVYQQKLECTLYSVLCAAFFSSP